jgi:hypothetical protein
MIVVVIVAVQGRPDQLSVRESFLLERTFGWHGIDGILHGTTCSQRRASHKPSLLFVWGIGGELRKYRSTGEIRMTMLK